MGYHNNMNERITIEPNKRSGQPCIRGMRITVKDVLEYLAGGMSRQEILEVTISRHVLPTSSKRSLKV